MNLRIFYFILFLLSAASFEMEQLVNKLLKILMQCRVYKIFSEIYSLQIVPVMK